MAKTFNVTADCKPNLHYMVKLDTRLKAIKELVDNGAYFTINRARQYGKTTILRALNQHLQEDYYVVMMDFQTFGAGEFANENIFSLAFAGSFLRILKRNKSVVLESFGDLLKDLNEVVSAENSNFRLQRLFEYLLDICEVSDKPIVLMIDEVDSATNNQVFLDFLAQLRAAYIDRDMQPTFQSVILAGVHDVKNLKRKLRPEEAQKINSPWNIAADFKVDLSFSEDEIAVMLQEYEDDHHTEMDIREMAKLLYEYTSGYPFLVSRLCKLMDEEVSQRVTSRIEKDTETAYSILCNEKWTKIGFHEAVKMLLEEKNTLFESLIGKLTNYPELNGLIEMLLFTGKPIVYNTDNIMIDLASMFGFVKNHYGKMMIANRIFEIRLYNYYLSTEEMHGKDIYTASLRDKNQFIINGRLDMRRILERFVIHFHDLYGDSSEKFLEDEGRKYFLLYLRPIINGVGNYYIEARTRDLRRTDIIVDYQGEQYIIEMKIWHGEEYNRRGEEQLIGYLEDYHTNIGYMLSFNFNKKKEIGVQEIVIGDKVLIEAVV